MPLIVVSHPVLAHALGILRDRDTPPAAFRDAARQIALGVLFEATRSLPTQPATVMTPLMEAPVERLSGRLGIVPILRAGMGFMDPIFALLPHAEIWHLGIFRNEQTLQPVTYYNKLHRASPPETVIVVDPMLATGGSASATLDVIRRWHGSNDERAVNIIFVCFIAAPEGIARLAQDHPKVPIFTAAVDERLNEVGYILPGLGDAGDRLFNTVSQG